MNHCEPMPLTRTPVSVPLRAVAVTTVLWAMPWAASMIALHETIEKLRKNCELRATKSSAWCTWSCASRCPDGAASGTPICMKNNAVEAALRLCTSSPISSACDWMALRSMPPLWSKPVRTAALSTGASTAAIHFSRCSTSGPLAPKRRQRPMPSLRLL